MTQVTHDAPIESSEQNPVKSLEAHPYLRALVVSLWAGFIGGVVFLAALLTDMLNASGLPGLREQSVFFFTAWLLSLVPATLAAVLTIPPSTRIRGAGNGD
jgi:hypothetical protein